MDTITLIKQLIAALQALVAIYMSQLAALAPQNATTTADLASNNSSSVLIIPTDGGQVAVPQETAYEPVFAAPIATTSSPWPETYVVETGIVRQALASVVTNGGSPSVQFTFLPTKGTLFDSATITGAGQVFQMQVNPVHYDGEDTNAAALTIPLASLGTSGDTVDLTAQVGAKGNTTEHTYQIVIP